MGLQWKGVGRGMSPSLPVGLSASALCGPPRPAGSGVEKGLHTLLCLLCLHWRISSLSCQCSDCMWRRGRGCVASSEKISCLYFIFCSCSTFFFSPHHSPLPMRVVCLNHILQNQFSKQIRWAAETAMQSGKNVHSSLRFTQWPKQYLPPAFFYLILSLCCYSIVLLSVTVVD